jgi:hypothetical protein
MNKSLSKKFVIENKLWIWPFDGATAWHFITVPPEIAAKIKKINESEVSGKKKMKRGFGSIKVKVKIGKTSFDTSIFPNKRDQTYLLPVKKEVRKKEGIQEGEKIKFTLTLL